MFHGNCQSNCYILGHSKDKTAPMPATLRFPWWQLAVTMLGFNFVTSLTPSGTVPFERGGHGAQTAAALV